MTNYNPQELQLSEAVDSDGNYGWRVEDPLPDRSKTFNAGLVMQALEEFSQAIARGDVRTEFMPSDFTDQIEILRRIHELQRAMTNG
jgi:hypothetical protein